MYISWSSGCFSFTLKLLAYTYYFSFHEFFISPLICQLCFNTALLLHYQYHAFSVIVSIFALKSTSLHECIHRVKIPNNTELFKTKYSHLPSLFSPVFTPHPRNDHFQPFGICIFRHLSVCLRIYTYVCDMG